jgi:predicted RNase H-like nuclease
MRVAGVDGTKGGWVAVVLEDGRLVDDLLLPLNETDFRRLGDVTVIGVDVPIGFGPRSADSAARAYLRGHASTVFTTPTEAVLRRPFAPGSGVNKQAHGLGQRILQVTALATADERIIEVHPEASFRAMNDDRRLGFKKKSAGGAFERLELLRSHGLDLTGVRACARAPLDDVLDAGAAAWSASRYARGEARSLPDPPERREGRDIAIWY